MVVFIQPITRLDYDELLAKTTPEMYLNLPINVNHQDDSEIGKVINVYVDKDNPNLVIGELAIKNVIWNKYKDKFGGISVELTCNEDKSVVIPTRVSLLTTDVMPKIKDTLNFRFEPIKGTNKSIVGYRAYSKFEPKVKKEYTEPIELNKEEYQENSILEKIHNLLKEIYKAVKPNTGQKVVDIEWNWQKEQKIIEKYCMKDNGTIDWDKYRKFFAWYDENNPEAKSSYKFPHHTVRNGEMVLVKKALYSAMAYINGARGVKIDEQIRQEAYKHLVEHYKKDLGEEPPELKDLKSETEVNNMDEAKYNAIINQIEELKKTIEELKGKYSETEQEKEQIKAEYSEKVKKYEEEIDTFKKTIKKVKAEYSEKIKQYEDKITSLEKEVGEIKAKYSEICKKYGLTDTEDEQPKKKYSNKPEVVVDMW